MIIDVKKIAEDKESVCYQSKSGSRPANLFLVARDDLTINAIVVGDEQTMAGVFAKLRRSLKTGEFPDFLSLATG